MSSCTLDVSDSNVEDSGSDQTVVIKEFVCEYPDCNATYQHLGRLHQHQRTKNHIVFEFEFGCGNCGCTKSFSTEEDLKLHRLKHDGPRPFLCESPNCPSTFTTYRQLSAHRRVHDLQTPSHPDAEEISNFESEKSHPICKFINCNREFVNFNGLKLHQAALNHIVPIVFTPKIPQLNITQTKNLAGYESIILNKRKEFLKMETKKPVLQKRCQFKDSKIWQDCLYCAKTLERTPQFFQILNLDNFATCPWGAEEFEAKCRSCKIAVLNIGEEGIKKALRAYPGLTLEWARRQIAEQNGQGLISGIELNWTGKGDFQAGVHRHNNLADHDEDNCFFDCQEMNVPQWTAIPSLIDAWTKVYIHFNSYLVSGHPCPNTAFEMAIEQSLADIMKLKMCDIDTAKKHHFRSILYDRVVSDIKADVRKGRLDRIPEHLRSVFYANAYNASIKQLERQGFRCFYSNINLVVAANIPTESFAQFSLERLNNDWPHFCGNGQGSNCVGIARLFNSDPSMSMAKVLTCYLNQTLVPREKLAEDVAKLWLATPSLLNVSREEDELSYTSATRWLQRPAHVLAFPEKDSKNKVQFEVITKMEALKAEWEALPKKSFLGQKTLDLPRLEIEAKLHKLDQRLAKLNYDICKKRKFAQEIISWENAASSASEN
jgi:hypothetical protein